MSDSEHDEKMVDEEVDDERILDSDVDDDDNDIEMYRPPSLLPWTEK